MEGVKKRVLFQPSTKRVTRATMRGEHHQPRSASAQRLEIHLQESRGKQSGPIH